MEHQQATSQAPLAFLERQLLGSGRTGKRALGDQAGRLNPGIRVGLQVPVKLVGSLEGGVEQVGCCLDPFAHLGGVQRVLERQVQLSQDERVLMWRLIQPPHAHLLELTILRLE